MILKNKLTLFEESYNEGYEQAIQDMLLLLNEKYPKNKKKHSETVDELLTSFEEKPNE